MPKFGFTKTNISQTENKHTKNSIMKHFNEYKQLNLAEVSKQILEQWEKEDLFHKSIETREGNPSFLFF